jgi:hypothetical protein
MPAGCHSVFVAAHGEADALIPRQKAEDQRRS